jgi:ribonuclease BN (tRNA processing enzyme)
MGRVVLLGTGAGDGGTHRNKSAILVQDGDGAVLLDAGEPVSQTILSLGLGREFLRAVFISHSHGDHAAGLPALIQDKQMGGRKKPLPLYLPAHLAQPLEDWLLALAMPKFHLGFPLEITALSPGSKLTAAGLEVEAFPTTHDCRDGRSSFGFIVRHNDRRLVYSADLGAASDLEPVLAEPVDLLICEMSHITPEDLLATLQGRTIGALILTHVGIPYLENLHKICRQFDEALPLTGQVFPGMDGESYPF